MRSLPGTSVGALRDRAIRCEAPPVLDPQVQPRLIDLLAGHLPFEDVTGIGDEADDWLAAVVAEMDREALERAH